MIYSISTIAAAPTESHPVLVMLHGRGADENDLFGFSRDLDGRLSIYSLRAPFEYEWGGYTWFHLFDDGTVDETSFEQSKDQILEFLTTLRSQKIILFGFSMGAILSYALALTDPERYSGIACLSGFAPLQLEKQYKLSELHNLQIFISHGINDPIIPITSARITQHFLESTAARLHYHEYPMGHEISPQCFDDVKSWISSLL